MTDRFSCRAFLRRGTFGVGAVALLHPWRRRPRRPPPVALVAAERCPCCGGKRRYEVQVPRESIEVGSETIDVVADEAAKH
jgi:hypothetical protein